MLHGRREFGRVERLLEQAVAQREIPGAVAAVGVGPDTLWETAVGVAEEGENASRPMSLETVFDLASLTKVVATLTAVLLLVEEGAFALSQPVGDFFPEFGTEGKDQVRLWHLLTHTSGLAPYREHLRCLSGYGEVLAGVLQEPLEYPPGTRVVYSDLGFILLGELVQRVTGEDLDRFVARRVFGPLGMDSAVFRPPAHWRERVAATERDARTGEPLVAVVHDETARAMGGVAGHAGLFATARDLSRYLAAWVDPEGLFAPWTRAAAARCYTEGLGGRRGLGWVLRHDSQDVAGDLWPETTLLHTGFTGTCMAVDPGSKAWAILLTNRVHFGRERSIQGLRRRFHNAVAGVLRIRA